MSNLNPEKAKLTLIKVSLFVSIVFFIVGFFTNQQMLFFFANGFCVGSFLLLWVMESNKEMFNTMVESNKIAKQLDVLGGRVNG